MTLPPFHLGYRSCIMIDPTSSTPPSGRRQRHEKNQAMKMPSPQNGEALIFMESSKRR
jgi:hypothetical protein